MGRQADRLTGRQTDRERHDMIRHDRTTDEKRTRQDQTRHGETRQNKTRQCKTRQDKTSPRPDQTGQGRLCNARQHGKLSRVYMVARLN